MRAGVGRSGRAGRPYPGALRSSPPLYLAWLRRRIAAAPRQAFVPPCVADSASSTGPGRSSAPCAEPVSALPWIAPRSPRHRCRRSRCVPTTESRDRPSSGRASSCRIRTRRRVRRTRPGRIESETPFRACNQPAATEVEGLHHVVDRDRSVLLLDRGARRRGDRRTRARSARISVRISGEPDARGAPSRLDLIEHRRPDEAGVGDPAAPRGEGAAIGDVVGAGTVPGIAASSPSFCSVDGSDSSRPSVYGWRGSRSSAWACPTSSSEPA